ncbi:DUF445 domain-containing protein [Clostridium psychrophilum]|uniref:DUF445 domain-containing protein n=1 Tax=Clostridium psychrophilum TaxID=132926 RepID=UPI001C0BEF02|nr:DUF445 domain-containing protein [Clostridium psychrophilum]MBU3180048.1 DUF445 domain-containing protein [Clostridium psychrophilum]
MRNKKIADLSVVVLILLVIMTVLIKINLRNNELLEMLSFVIEAALVGSIADWFAITALFEKPFLVGKLPIIASHTAIISKNRDSIVNAVSNMVENKLLSKKALKNKIEEINIIDSLINFINRNIDTKSELYQVLIDYFKEKINNIDTLKLAKFLETHLKEKIEVFDFSVYLDKYTEYGINNSEFKEMFNKLIDSLIIYVNDDARKNILKKFANDFLKKESNSLVMEKFINILKSVNAINTLDVVNAILNQINKILLNLKDENDLLRCQLIKNIEKSFDKMLTDNKIRNNIEKWKTTTLKEISLQDDLNTIIKNVIKVITSKEMFLYNYALPKTNNLKNDLSGNENIVSFIAVAKTNLGKYWNVFKNSYINKKIIDQYIKQYLFEFMGSKYKNVGKIVKQVLNNMDDKSLNNFVKQKAGNELHGIRLNGCIIGALFGGVVFVVTHLIYDLILPNIFNFKF